MYNDTQDPNSSTSPYTQPAPTGPTAVQQGLQPVPGHPGLFFNTAGVVFNEAGTTVDGYVNPATGAFQTGTPTTNPTTGIVGPPTPAPTTNPPTTEPPTGGGGGGTPAPAPTGGTTSFPSGQAPPTFTPPTYEKPPVWNYSAFIAPDPSEVNSDPWTQFQLKAEGDQIQRSAAARGILNTGGTIDSLLHSSADITNAGYANIFNRAAQTYGINRQNSLDNFNVNYGTQYSDPQKWSYAGAQDDWNAKSHVFDMGNQYAWAKTLFGEQQASNEFDRKYRIYSSL